MAKVKKVVEKEPVEVVEEAVEVTEEIETELTEEETEVGTPIEEPVVEVEVPIEEPQEEQKDDLVVDKSLAKVDNSKKPNGLVKIRMRTDHRCCIAMERYDLKAGKTYNVPANVKEILNNAGLLSPL